MPTMQETITVQIRSVVYKSPEGWAVLRFESSNGETQTVVGPVAHLQPQDTAEITGEWKRSAKWGRQYVASSAVASKPASSKGIMRYLSDLPQCGPRRAKRIYEEWGDESIEVLESRPELVERVLGSSAKTICEAARKRAGRSRAYVQLLTMGCHHSVAHTLVERYGHDVADMVRENPYMITAIRGVGFKTADQIAMAVGFPIGGKERVQAGIRHVLREAAVKGNLYLREPQWASDTCRLLRVEKPTALRELANMEEDGKVVVDGSAVYLEAYHRAECMISQRLAEMIATPPLQSREPGYDSMEIELDSVQKRGVEMARSSPVSVLTGGPGTGKTTICRVIVDCFDRVMLCAPTGRAAKRLADSTGRSASTIHRLLDYHPQEGWRVNRHSPLPPGLVVVDESSMVSTPLMSRLVDALTDRNQLLMVGDSDQLPPVGPGRVLADLLESGVVPSTRLSQIRRQSAGSMIVKNAHRINSGMVLEEENLNSEGFYLVQESDAGRLTNSLVEGVAASIPEKFGVDPTREVCVLTPQNRGPLGVDELNRRLRERLNPTGKKIGFLRDFRVGDRVMQWRNDYELDVFNGDTGVVAGSNSTEQSISIDMDDGRRVSIPRERCGHLRLAFASTVHKSQGSEYPVVVMVVDRSHHFMLRRKLLYTGVTRAKRVLVIYGQASSVDVAIQRNVEDQRNSGLSWRLREEELEGSRKAEGKQPKTPADSRHTSDNRQ